MRSLPWLSALPIPGVLAVLAIPVPILPTATSADVRALHGHTIIAPRITIHSRHGAISRRILVIGLSWSRRSDVHADAHLGGSAGGRDCQTEHAERSKKRGCSHGPLLLFAMVAQRRC